MVKIIHSGFLLLAVVAITSCQIDSQPTAPSNPTGWVDDQRIIEAEVEPRLLAVDGVQRVNLDSERDPLVLISGVGVGAGF